MIAYPEVLKVAYLANIVILVPVCAFLFAGRARGVGVIFQDAVVDSAGLRLLVGSLWFAILAASAAGLVWPAFFAPVLAIQIVYKTLWLVLFVAPLIMSRRGARVPWGIAITFAAIVMTYPIILWLAFAPE